MSGAGEFDPLGLFLAARVTRSKGGRVSSLDMHAAFLRWAEANNARPWPPGSFSAAMRERGFVKVRLSQNYWTDVALRPALALVPQ